MAVDARAPTAPTTPPDGEAVQTLRPDRAGAGVVGHGGFADADPPRAVAVGLPAVLDTTSDNAAWLVTVTLLTSAVATPILSRLADMHGKRRMIVVALIALLVGSLLGAASCLTRSSRRTRRRSRS